LSVGQYRKGDEQVGTFLRETLVAKYVVEGAADDDDGESGKNE
jgi:hypothetical protein